jgi:hypothetical protein
MLILAGTANTAHAQSGPAGGPSPAPPGAMVYFVDLKNNQTVPTKFTVHFGLKGMGVAPAGSDKENSGHHHLLIDTEVPPLDQPIPNDFNHLHFGAGQTEADVTLTPGNHTLQLLLGDKNHVPTSPALLSDKITVRVANNAPAPQASAAPGATSGRHPSPAGAKVYFAYPSNNAYIKSGAVIRFGLIGMGVAPAGFEKVNTGHHHLLIDTDLPPFDQPIPNDFNHLHFGTGQTEAKVTLPAGKHKLQLLLGDENHVPHDPPVYSEAIQVTVNESGREPVVEERKPRRRQVREVREVRRHAPRPVYRSAPRGMSEPEPRGFFPFF